MDKYEYNLKLEEIDKLVDQGDYEEAAKLADTIDWRRVRNVRTLCLISEIYEAAGRLEDSKNLLVRAYRKSPVGKTVLYRLVEVTTALRQYDEAIEYYSEYVQAAPHDNNRYILKYKIYKGRGNSVEELITILEEYLGQEYTERWAYELAKLYQQAGQMQKCFAACDDLVLWFHSGKYVRKALELKMRYTSLTPRQQQIYEECLQEDLEERMDDPQEEEDNVIQNVETTDGEVLAESIIAETEREIASQVMARKAEMEREASEAQKTAESEDMKDNSSAVIQQEMKDEKADMPSAPAVKEAEAATQKTAEEKPKPQEKPEEEPEDQKDLQVELAKSMRKIISGVVKRVEEDDEDVPASVDPKLQRVQKLTVPEMPEQSAGQLSIDDILLSMGDKGKKIADAVIEAGELEEEEAADEIKAAQSTPSERRRGMRSVSAAAEEELTDIQREALQYTSHPEKLLRNRRALPTYTEEKTDLGKTRKIVNTKEELLEAAKKEILAEKTIRIPVEQVRKGRLPETDEDGQSVQEDGKNLPEEQADALVDSEVLSQDEEYTSEEAYYDSDEPVDEGYEEDADYDEDGYDESYEEAQPDDGDYEEAYDDDEYDEEYEDEEYLMIPEHLRGLFRGFTEVEGLEDQIANAIIQAEAKGDDRTSRSGNILIFGAHGSGKTTLAMNLAKAIAQDKGSQVMKMARIYAADLNRKDIAATIAKIAGGTLIIEEAGDLEPGTVEQLTTAMEFRTDGLVVILEDEQQYIHELLMRHPRFTMKFTAQIYIPVYTVDELARFGEIYANSQDFTIGEEAYDVFCDKLSEAAEAAEEGKVVSIIDAIDIVSRAINRSNKFFRKLSMGKKRYDEKDYAVLFPKDFK